MSDIRAAPGVFGRVSGQRCKRSACGFESYTHHGRYDEGDSLGTHRLHVYWVHSGPVLGAEGLGFVILWPLFVLLAQ